MTEVRPLESPQRPHPGMVDRNTNNNKEEEEEDRQARESGGPETDARCKTDGAIPASTTAEWVVTEANIWSGEEGIIIVVIIISSSSSSRMGDKGRGTLTGGRKVGIRVLQRERVALPTAGMGKESGRRKGALALPGGRTTSLDDRATTLIMGV